MQQVKIFKSIESELDQLETEMNRWLVRLHKKGGKVVNIFGNIAAQASSGSGFSSSFSASDVLVIVMYEISQSSD